MAEYATITCPTCGKKTVLTIEVCDIPELNTRNIATVTRYCSECDAEIQATVEAIYTYEVTVADYCADPENCVKHAPRTYTTHG